VIGLFRLRGIGIALALWGAALWADTHEVQAQSKIEATPCGGTTLGERLADETRIHSRRDLGWRFFPGSGYMDVERALRVSKSMEIRYRWRMDGSGRVEALTEPAQMLCR
jgi:hypothetical protein